MNGNTYLILLAVFLLVIIGKALYENRINLKEAVRAFEGIEKGE